MVPHSWGFPGIDSGGFGGFPGSSGGDPRAPRVVHFLPQSNVACNHSAIFNLSFLGLEQDMATTWPYNGFPEQCVLHHFSSLTRWNGSRGQVRLGNDRKRPKLEFEFMFLGL